MSELSSKISAVVAVAKRDGEGGVQAATTSDSEPMAWQATLEEARMAAHTARTELDLPASTLARRLSAERAMRAEQIVHKPGMDAWGDSGASSLGSRRDRLTAA